MKMTMIRALQFGFEAIQPLIDVQEKMAREVGKPKREYTSYQS
jgi:polyribonucleotide nucleotidyltransferase